MLDAERMDSRIRQLVMSFLSRRGSKAIKMNDSRFPRYWLFFDMLSVILHMLTIFFFTFIPLMIGFF